MGNDEREYGKVGKRMQLREGFYCNQSMSFFKLKTVPDI